MAKEEKPKIEKQNSHEARLIRILSKDISGDKTVYSGLTKIKGVSWAVSSAICKRLEIGKKKKVGELDKAELKKIGDFINNPDIPNFLKNRRRDIYSGENKHLNGADLDLQKEFDIKRLKKIRSYKGARHSAGLPVRGQRTKSNFRRNRKKGGAVGVSKKGAKRV